MKLRGGRHCPYSAWLKRRCAQYECCACWVSQTLQLGRHNMEGQVFEPASWLDGDQCWRMRGTITVERQTALLSGCGQPTLFFSTPAVLHRQSCTPSFHIARVFIQLSHCSTFSTASLPPPYSPVQPISRMSLIHDSLCSRSCMKS